MIFIYFKVLIFTVIIFFSGLVIIRRAIKDTRIQILAPTALIFGLSLYLFLTNALAYFIKGPSLFYISLAVEIILASIVYKVQPSQPLEFPNKAIRLFWILSLIFWGTLLFIITNTSPFNGGHDAEYQSFASLFTRGDYPLHTPWQPDYLAFLHLGASQLLGSLKILTGANYHSIQAFIAFISLFSCSQILTWVLDFKNLKSFWSKLILFIPAFTGIISLGNFMIVWPAKIALPDISGGLVNWLTSLPALELPNPPQFPHLGHLDYVSLDAIILFLQRVTAISFFIGLLPVLLSPSDNKKYFISKVTIIILLATIALTDESVLFPILPVVFFIAIFTFKKHLSTLIALMLLALFTIAIQGGTVTEALLNRYGMGSGTLMFPEDRENPFEKFRSWRLAYQSSYLYDDLPKLQPFRWFRPGIIWLLPSLLFAYFWITISTKKEVSDQEKLKLIILIMLLSSLGSLVAYHIIVPYPFHSNGWRFLFLSYELAGIGIGFSLIYFWEIIPRKLFFIKIIIIWILVFSFFPSLLRLFPRRSDLSWFIQHPEPKKPIFEWIKNNLPLNSRIIALTDANPIPSSNMDLVKQIGAFTPIWPAGIRNYDAFDTSPTYADLYYTLNPASLEKLNADYLIINSLYLAQLPEIRKSDISNKEFFQPIYSDSGESILKVSPKYIEKAGNLGGTLEELEKIAPKIGSFYIDHKSTHEFINLYRSLVLIFRDREFYGITDYWNSRLSVNIPFYGITSDRYDYIIGGHNLDTQSICQCQTQLLWSGLDGRVNLWKVQ